MALCVLKQRPDILEECPNDTPLGVGELDQGQFPALSIVEMPDLALMVAHPLCRLVTVDSLCGVKQLGGSHQQTGVRLCYHDLRNEDNPVPGRRSNGGQPPTTIRSEWIHNIARARINILDEFASPQGREGVILLHEQYFPSSRRALPDPVTAEYDQEFARVRCKISIKSAAERSVKKEHGGDVVASTVVGVGAATMLMRSPLLVAPCRTVVEVVAAAMDTIGAIRHPTATPLWPQALRPRAVAARLAQWRAIGADNRTLSWLKHGVPVEFLGDKPPPAFELPPLPVSPEQRRWWFEKEEPRLVALRAISRVDSDSSPEHVCNALCVPKPGAANWRVVVNLKRMNIAQKGYYKCRYETLKVCAVLRFGGAGLLAGLAIRWRPLGSVPGRKRHRAGALGAFGYTS